jgi:hypothetical protein
MVSRQDKEKCKFEKWVELFDEECARPFFIF